MTIKIALAGNPNCGKTTLFNELTGSNQYVGNWPGVTVEKKDGMLKGHKDVVIQDLPGIYSLSPYTMEEVVTRKYLVNDKPDVIINIVDGTNMERNLYLTTQLLELNIPTIIAVNMMDVVRKNGDEINFEKLSKSLSCTVMPLSALKGDGCASVVAKAIEIANSARRLEVPHVFEGSVEHALAHIEESLEDMVDAQNLRWYAVKVFERDEKVLENLRIPADVYEHLEQHIVDCEKEMDDDAESIITNQRYAYIEKLASLAIRKSRAAGSQTLSDKIDSVVTHRIFALPIFAVAIWFMYWISVSTLGTWMTDWANDGVFGDGWFVAWTRDSAIFTSKEVKERNAQARSAFNPKAALKKANQEIKKKNAIIRAEWQLAAAKAWAEGKPLPEEPDYEETLSKVKFKPETWESVSGEYEDAAKRAETFEAHYSKALGDIDTFVMRLAEESAAADALGKKAAERLAASDSDAEAVQYAELLKADASEKAALLAAAKAIAASEAAKAGNTAKKNEVFRIEYPDFAKLLKVKVFFEDEESGEIDHAETLDYEGYLASRKAASEENRPEPSKYGLWVPGIPGLVEAFLDKIGVNDFLKNLILNGIIDGVGTVFGFLPQILIVFLFLAFMEDCGYMARIAFIMDRIFRRFGLSGKSFIPMLIGTGCGVPAVMASRTIENVNDRRMTIILSTFMPCGAKLAIIAMIVAAFFPESNLVGPSMYFIGIAIVVLGGFALKKTCLFTGEASPFVMELPAYHLPTLKGIFIHTWDRGKSYAIKAATVIFTACIVLWLLMNFDWSFNVLDSNTAEGLERCMLHDIGQCIAWIFRPLGFGNWQGAVACISAEVAKEQATATLALLSPDVAGGTLKGIQALFADMVPASVLDPAMRTAYAKVIAFSFLVCNLFFPPCIVAIATTWREMGTAKWGCIALVFQLLVGYLLALVCFNLGIMLNAGAGFGPGQLAAVIVILVVLYMILRPASKSEK